MRRATTIWNLGLGRRLSTQVRHVQARPAVRSAAVTSILFQDQNALLTWASGFAAEYVKAQSERRAQKELFALDWDTEKRIAGEKFKEYSEARKQVGVRVHEAISKMLTAPGVYKPDLAVYADDPETSACIEAVQKWISSGRFKVIKSEIDVRSVRHKYHGRIDCVARDTRTQRVCILDFKIKPKELDFTTAMQLAAYVSAYNEMNSLHEGSPDFCTEAVAIQIKYEQGSGAQVLEKKVKDLLTAERAFQCRHILYRLENARDPRQGFSDAWLFDQEMVASTDNPSTPTESSRSTTSRAGSKNGQQKRTE